MKRGRDKSPPLGDEPHDSPEDVKTAKLVGIALLTHPFWAQALEWTFANNPGLGQSTLHPLRRS